MFGHLENDIMQGGHKLKKLLKARADPNKTNASGFSPLHRACDPRCHNLEATRLLIDARADVNMHGGPDKRTPLHKVLSSPDSKCPSDLVDMLLQRKADVNAQTGTFNPDQIFWHQTPLHIAARNQHKLAVKLLLDAKANHTLQTHTGLTANDMWQAASHERNGPNCEIDEDIINLLSGCKQGTLVEKAFPIETEEGQITIMVPPKLKGPLVDKLMERVLNQDWVLISIDDIPIEWREWQRKMEDCGESSHQEWLLNVQQHLKIKRSNIDHKACAACGLEGESLLKCSKCLQTYYCSNQCQRNEWKKHKHECMRPIPKVKAFAMLVMPQYSCFMQYASWAGEQPNHSPTKICSPKDFKKNFGEEAELRTVLQLAQHGRPYDYFEGIAGDLKPVVEETVELVIRDRSDLESDTILIQALVARGYETKRYSFSVSSENFLTDAVGSKFNLSDDLEGAQYPWTMVVFVKITDKSTKKKP